MAPTNYTMGRSSLSLPIKSRPPPNHGAPSPHTWVAPHFVFRPSHSGLEFPPLVGGPPCQLYFFIIFYPEHHLIIFPYNLFNRFTNSNTKTITATQIHHKNKQLNSQSTVYHNIRRYKTSSQFMAQFIQPIPHMIHHIPGYRD